MWLGTRTGRPASKVRAWFIRQVLFRPPIKQSLAPYFAMLTIPRPTLGPRYVRGRPIGEAGVLEVMSMTTIPVNQSKADLAPPLRPLNGLSLDEHLRVPELKRAYNERLFTRVAGRYGFVTLGLSLGRDRAWKRRLVRALPEVARPMCVDLACGTGDITRLLAGRYPDGEVHGIDLTPAMLDLARRRGLPGVIFSRQDMGQLSFQDESVHIVTGGYALRNAPNLKVALAEVHQHRLRDGDSYRLQELPGAGQVPANERLVGYLPEPYRARAIRRLLPLPQAQYAYGRTGANF